MKVNELYVESSRMNVGKKKVTCNSFGENHCIKTGDTEIVDEIKYLDKILNIKEDLITEIKQR